MLVVLYDKPFGHYQRDHGSYQPIGRAREICELCWLDLCSTRQSPANGAERGAGCRSSLEVLQSRYETHQVQLANFGIVDELKSLILSFIADYCIVSFLLQVLSLTMEIPDARQLGQCQPLPREGLTTTSS